MYKFYSTIIKLYYSYDTILEEDELFPLDEHSQHIFDIKNAAENGKFRHIQNFIKARLSINHGDTDVEGSLSDNKNILIMERISLSKERLKGLQRCKQYSRNAGGAHQALVSKQIINKVKDAHLNHTICKRKNKKGRISRVSKRRKTNIVRKDN